MEVGKIYRYTNNGATMVARCTHKNGNIYQMKTIGNNPFGSYYQDSFTWSIKTSDWKELPVYKTKLWKVLNDKDGE